MTFLLLFLWGVQYTANWLACKQSSRYLLDKREYLEVPLDAALTTPRVLTRSVKITRKLSTLVSHYDVDHRMAVKNGCVATFEGDGLAG